jgi:hypothetical protein
MYKIRPVETLPLRSLFLPPGLPPRSAASPSQPDSLIHLPPLPHARTPSKSRTNRTHLLPLSVGLPSPPRRVRARPPFQKLREAKPSQPMATANTAAAGAATPALAPTAPATLVQVPRGQVDLADFIDWTLNQDSSHSITNALKQVAHSSPGRTLARLDHPSRWFQKDFQFWCCSSDFGGIVGCPPLVWGSSS